MHGLAVLNSSWCSVALRRKAARALPFCTSTSKNRTLSCGLEHMQINGMWQREGGLMCSGLILVGAREASSSEVQPRQPFTSHCHYYCISL